MCEARCARHKQFSLDEFVAVPVFWHRIEIRHRQYWLKLRCHSLCSWHTVTQGRLVSQSPSFGGQAPVTRKKVNLTTQSRTCRASDQRLPRSLPSRCRTLSPSAPRDCPTPFAFRLCDRAMRDHYSLLSRFGLRGSACRD